MNNNFRAPENNNFYPNNNFNLQGIYDREPENEPRNAEAEAALLAAVLAGNVAENVSRYEIRTRSICFVACGSCCEA
jgi:hypothetical protein